MTADRQSTVPEARSLRRTLRRGLADAVGLARVLSSDPAKLPRRLERVARIVHGRRRYWRWRREHPGGRFADFYVDRNLGSIAEGRVQPNLGEVIDEHFDNLAPSTVRTLERFGLEPGHLLVDLGCGSLRLGRHLIDWLDPGRYVGMDVTPDFIEMGRRRLADGVEDARRPRFFALTPATLAEVGALAPAFVVSVGVQFHVHPSEIDGYLDSIMGLLGPDSVAYIKVLYWDLPTLPISGESWVYRRSVLEQGVATRGGHATMLRERDEYLEGLEIVATDAWMRVRRTP